MEMVILAHGTGMKIAYMYVKRLIALYINIYACVSLQTNWKLIFFFNFIYKMSVCVLSSRIFFFLMIHCWYFRHLTLDCSEANAWLSICCTNGNIVRFVLTRFFSQMGMWYYKICKEITQIYIYRIGTCNQFRHYAIVNI